MLDILAATSGSNVIHWADLGLKEGIEIGPLTLRYYSLAYLGGIILAYWHLSKMIKAPGAPMAQRHVDDLFFYCTLGVILGGRLGYALFYKPELFTGWTDDVLVKWDLLRLWDGGMSFHGGLLGVLAAIGWVSRRDSLSFIRVCDYVSVNVGFGMLFGRLANFINGELWGRPVESDVPWAMTFCDQGRGALGECLSSFTARHPSQLYQALLEGALVIVVMLPLFWKSRARFRPGLLVATFTAILAAGRFVAEFFRQPDEHLTEFAASSGLSMGQWLTIPLLLAAIAVMVWALRRPPLASGAAKPAKA